MLSSLVITFLPRSKRLLISWLQSPSAVMLEPKKIKSDTVSTVSQSICHEVMGPDAIFVFWVLIFKSTFSLSSFTFIKRLFISSSLSAIRVVSTAYLRLLIFLPAILIPACASSCPQFFLASLLFKWGGFFLTSDQSVGASASASVIPMNIQDWSPSEWTGWISLQSKGLKSLLQHHSSKASILRHSAFFTVQLSHPYMTTGKTIALTRRTFVGKIMFLLFNMLSRLVITFLPRSKCLLISWLQ